MGRKKKKPVKPWCWYCNREFDDDKILVQHQRAKHFKCPFCHKKLYSGPGLTVHCIQVHKETLDKIPEALPNRNSVDIDIYGMQGVPEEDVREHERLKRGDTAAPKSSNDHAKPSQQSQQKNHPQNAAPSMAAMHAAMFQHAMGLGPMPPGFPVQTAQVPGFMPPPGFPPMLIPPGVPPPVGYTPSLLNPTSFPSPLGPPMGFPIPPPLLGPVPSTSGHMPPPMSGVGHLIGIPPPQFSQHVTPPAPSTVMDKSNLNASHHHEAQHQQSQTSRSQAAHSDTKRQLLDSSSSNQNLTSSSTTISKPASTTAGLFSSKVEASSSFMEVQSSKSRIMHPNIDLSLEEIRLKLKKYAMKVNVEQQT